VNELVDDHGSAFLLRPIMPGACPIPNRSRVTIQAMAPGNPTTVYTDGACSGNPGPGGWAWATPAGRFASGADPHTTNQRMEITAALEAVRALDGPLDVVSDSTYVVNCFRDRWWEGWIRRDWKNSQRKPVANRDLWEPLIELVRARGDVTFRWVKGHGGDPMNDIVDRLAVEAALTQEGRSGDRLPDDLGPPDDLGRAASAGPADLPGHPLVVFGHRPPELGGYDDNPVADAVRRQLTEILRAKREVETDLVAVTGLMLGAETLAAEAAVAADVPFIAVLPYPDPDKAWPPASRRRYESLLSQAIDVVSLQQKVPDSKPKVAGAMARRDAWLARNAREAVIVWDEDDAALAKLYRSLVDHLGEENIWILRPPPVSSGAQ
jgi:ribonuclease HI